MQTDPPVDPVPVLVLTGTIGAGKTSVGRAASHLLGERGVPHALIDLDWMETFWTPSREDDHDERVLHRNVASVWANYRAAGCSRLIFSRVVEAPAVLDRLVAAVPGARPVVVWLDAPAEQTLRRLRAREPDDPSWFVDASVRVAQRVVPTEVAQHVIAVADHSPSQLARQALRAVGWWD